jgi:hypothetical protein
MSVKPISRANVQVEMASYAYSISRLTSLERMARRDLIGSISPALKAQWAEGAHRARAHKKAAPLAKGAAFKEDVHLFRRLWGLH